jgi:putative sterol carrier protein
MQKFANVQESFDRIHERFKPDEASGVDATFVYELDGAGAWTICVKDAKLRCEPGGVEKPTVTFKIKAKDYLDLINGDLNGAKAFLTRKLKVSGSLPMAQKMNKFLPPLS